MAQLLSLDKVSCTRGGMVVLAGVAFSVEAGQVLVLRGPNGSGKTTLLRTISGLQPPAAGQVTVDADDIAYAAHADAIKATLTVSENLTFWARLFGQSDITPALAAFRLEDLAKRPAQSLSAGQKRRLGLARMCVTGRALWLMDEPTVSLDKDAVAMFAQAVRAHLENGGAAIIATHIDLGLEAETLDLGQFKPSDSQPQDFDEAFL